MSPVRRTLVLALLCSSVAAVPVSAQATTTVSAAPSIFHTDQGLDILADGSPSSQVIECDSQAEMDGIEQTATAGSSSLSYDAASDTYTYVWKTSKSWDDTCRQPVREDVLRWLDALRETSGTRAA